MIARKKAQRLIAILPHCSISLRLPVIFPQNNFIGCYRKTGYSKRFLETHRTEITLHKAAKAAFDESNLRTLPKVKELDAEYSNLLTEKKARYPDYRKAKEEMQELLRAKRNVELFFAEEKSSAEKTKSR